MKYVECKCKRAFSELTEFCGFEYYGRKYPENILNAFIQLFRFPKKFGVDSRTSHFSSMIVFGQMTREGALKEFSESLYDETQMNGYIDIIRRNHKISESEFNEIEAAPIHQHYEYKVDDSNILFKVAYLTYRIKKKIM